MVSVLLAIGLFHTQVRVLTVNSSFTERVSGWKAVRCPIQVSGSIFQTSSNPTPGQQPWDWSVGQPIGTAIAKGEVLLLTLIGRSKERGRVSLCFELNQSPFGKEINRTITLGPEYSMVRLVTTASRDYAANESQLSFHLGHKPATFEFKQIKLETYGPKPTTMPVENVDPFDGQPNPQSWRVDAEKRIDQIRKGDLTIEVRKGGKPVSGAKIQLTQTQHEFGFGSAVVAAKLNGKTPDDLRYQKEVERLFNVVVFENDLKWGMPETSLEEADKAIPWLQSRHIKIRGHNLVWGSYRWAKPLVGLTKDDTIKAIEKRVASSIERFKGKVYTWDVVNEAATETEVWEKIGWDQFPRTYKLAQQADPNLLLTYNDYDIANQARGDAQYQLVKKRVQELIDAGAKVDILGDQAHMALPLTPISKVLEVWNDFSKFGKPLEITEFDVAVRDDRLHGQYVSDFLTAAFSEPNMQSFLMWGFWENAHWLAKEGGAMFRADWTKRPGQVAFEDLVFNKWWTRVNGQTSKKGQLSTRAFYGTHAVVVEANGEKKSFSVDLKKGGPSKVVLKLD